MVDLSVSDAVATRYVIDQRVSRFTVKVFASGLLSALGHNPTVAVRDLAGEIRFSPDTPDVASVTITVKASSLAVQDDVKESDRHEIERVMFQDVLEASRYPEIVFQSSRVTLETITAGRYRAKVEGNLALHGLTRPQTITTQVFLSGNTLRAQAEFPLRQTEFGIAPVSVAGGTLKVKDELKCAFDIVARAQN
jgi:polyisoprenoid-binding protein YceI